MGLPEDLRCRYPSKVCDRPRARKLNGELHRLCDVHRHKANQNQMRWQRRRQEDARTTKRLRGRAADGSGGYLPSPSLSRSSLHPHEYSYPPHRPPYHHHHHRQQQQLSPSRQQSHPYYYGPYHHHDHPQQRHPDHGCEPTSPSAYDYPFAPHHRAPISPTSAFDSAPTPSSSAMTPTLRPLVSLGTAEDPMSRKRLEARLSWSPAPKTLDSLIREPLTKWLPRIPTDTHTASSPSGAAPSPRTSAHAAGLMELAHTCLTRANDLPMPSRGAVETSPISISELPRLPQATTV